MMWMWDDVSWWWWLLMSAGMVLFWGAIAAAVVALLRSIGPPVTRVTGPDAQQILAERYARGEIDEAEYRRRLDTLQRPGADRTTEKPGAPR